MEVSLLSLLALLPAQGAGKGDLIGANGEAGLEGGVDASSRFEQWLDDLGAQDGLPGGADMPAMDAALFDELVPNLVLAQGETRLTPAQILQQLTGVDEVDMASLATLSLTKDQANTFSALVQKFLQRPDTAANLTESQRSMLQQMSAQLQQAGEEGEPLANVLKPLMTPVSKAEMRERAPVAGQVLQWLKNVLRDTRPVQTAQALADAEALPKGAARVGFPGSADDADTAVAAETDDETLADQVVPVLAAPVIAPEPAALAGQDAAPAVKGWPALADALADEAAQAALAADGGEAAGTDTPAKTNGGIPSADFAQLVANSEAQDAMIEAMNGSTADLTLKAAAALAQPVQAPATERVLGGSATGEVKVLGAAPHQEKALAQAESRQAVAAAVESQQVDDAPQPAVEADSGSDGLSPVPGVATASGFQVGQSNHASPVSLTAHYANARVPVPEQVQVAVRHAAAENMDRIRLQLQPEELGRIDVRLDMHADGRAHIVFTVDKPETFEHLQRDARYLERALQDAGVQTDAGSMEFNLRQHAQQEMAGFGDHDRSQQETPPQAFTVDENGVAAVQANDTDDLTETLTRTYTLTSEPGLDIRV